MYSGRAKNTLYALLVLLLISWGCGNDNSNPVNTPDSSTLRSDVPVQLAKEWYYGNISSTNFYNPVTGQFSAPSGVGMYFKFSADGYYEKGVLLQSSLYGCSFTFFGFKKGTVFIEGNKMTLYPVFAKIKSEDNCVAENNYEKADTAEPEVIYWENGIDEYDTETLWLSYENSNPSAFHVRD